MKLRLVLQIFTAILLYSALTFYIGYNGWIWLHNAFNLEEKWIYWIILGGFSYSYFIAHRFKGITAFKIIGAYWFGVLQYSILLLPLANLTVFLLHYFTKITLGSAIVITGIGVLSLFLLLFAYGSYNAYSPVVRNYSITIPKHAPKLQKLRIAMASDMHFGTLSGVAHLKRLIKEVNALEPDIILLPGDIIDDDPEPFIKKKMGNTMAQLHAPLGVYGVLGNHEYYGGAIPAFVTEMDRIGIKILQDSVLKVADSFYLVGRKDKTDKERKLIKELTSDLDPSMPVIMMDHQPTQLTEAEQHQVDLILSGHTHRGQMAPNHLITKKVFELDWGYLQKNQLHAIVSSGYGFWGPPLRIGSRSEIIQIEISFNEASLT